MSKYLLRLSQYLDPSPMGWYFKLWFSQVIPSVLARLSVWEL